MLCKIAKVRKPVVGVTAHKIEQGTIVVGFDVSNVLGLTRLGKLPLLCSNSKRGPVQLDSSSHVFLPSTYDVHNFFWNFLTLMSALRN